MIKLLGIVVFGFILTGCAALQTLTGKAATVNDEALNTAEWTICYAASIGAIRRKYSTPEKAKVWRELCSTGEFSPEE